ncbi:hypothetical protein E1262_01480 [Jiangella aurantiaca]|uniref:Uncharacterized protein n=1 Tax=Jiangella aurantiaca TaxID=2530373 RepID=A0A4R5AIU9_9ACTN|nr:hypothetical protein [Jiangella aurantiaca]TDD72563.1 hypothetical protein E1262_01480 [Jiangella aurantiaca]
MRATWSPSHPSAPLRRVQGSPRRRGRRYQRLVTVATTGTAPLHQLLGSDSLGFADARVESLEAGIESARALAVTTDIPQS